MASGKPRLKLSESVHKVSFPDVKQVHRFSDAHGTFMADTVSLWGEDANEIKEMHHPFDKDKSLTIPAWSSEPLQEKVMEKGKTLQKTQHPVQSYAYLKRRLEKLPDEYKRFENPHMYKVGLSTRLNDLRDGLIRKFHK
jgi:nicotinate phosphoribosyltransferase